MINPVYPQHQYRIKKEGEIRKIFCENRKLWVKLTPEEWVRQNFFQYLIKELNYPPVMIAMEKEIRLFELTKRFDLLVYDRSHKPWLMVECKAQSVPLNEKTLMQVLRYNMAIPVPFLVMTNGSYARVIKRAEGGIEELNLLPQW